MTHAASKDDQIEQLERRLELRRERLRRHYDITRTEFVDKGHRLARSAGKAIGWVPVAAVAGGLVVGFVASRYPRQAREARPVYAPAYAYAAPKQRTRSRNFLAALVGIAATAMRIASSHEVRTIWKSVKNFRDRPKR